MVLLWGRSPPFRSPGLPGRSRTAKMWKPTMKNSARKKRRRRHLQHICSTWHCEFCPTKTGTSLHPKQNRGYIYIYTHVYTRLWRQLRPLRKCNSFFQALTTLRGIRSVLETSLPICDLKNSDPRAAGESFLCFILHFFAMYFYHIQKNFSGMPYLVAIFGQLSQNIPYLTSSSVTTHGTLHHIQ